MTQYPSDQFSHSVRLAKEKCVGCTNCIKRCPTKAIRVRDGKARIISERCVDCGECIRVCPHHAKLAFVDPLDSIESFPYRVALPAPALYAQFNNLSKVDIVINALLKIGFDDVFEVAKAAEIVSAETRRLLQQSIAPRPLISSACPAIIRLIRIRFPSLIEHMLPFRAPVEVAARLALKQAMQKTGLPSEEIGLVFITPCPAKVTAAKNPIGTTKSAISKVVSVCDIYPRLIKEMTISPDAPPPEILSSDHAGSVGVSWCCSSGESTALARDHYLAVDGMEQVIRILEGLEDEKFPHLDFVELNACTGGCVGGVLNVENPFIARTKLEHLKRYLPTSTIPKPISRQDLCWDEQITFHPVAELDPNIAVAMHKMQEIDRIDANLPQLDCGACGSPTCRSFAEDVVRGVVPLTDCIVKLRQFISTDPPPQAKDSPQT